MITLTLWFDNIPQAQDWQAKLRRNNWIVSEIASRKGKRITIEIEFPLDNKESFFYFNRELENNYIV